MIEPFNIFIGYDRNEHEAYMVAQSSLLRRSNSPVLIHPLSIDHLHYLVSPPIKRADKLWCPESDAPCSTEFARSRFCVPFLQRDGWALFMDADMVVRTDINEILQFADESKAVMVVKHQYEPQETTKMDGQIQTVYPRKNWSSVMLWNCSHRAHYRLTKERLNNWAGRRLHAFEWLEDEEIGELPDEWNHLVGVTDAKLESAKILHYTLGGMWTDRWKEQPSDRYWLDEYKYLRGEQANVHRPKTYS